MKKFKIILVGLALAFYSSFAFAMEKNIDLKKETETKKFKLIKMQNIISEKTKAIAEIEKNISKVYNKITKQIEELENQLKETEKSEEKEDLKERINRLKEQQKNLEVTYSNEYKKLEQEKNEKDYYEKKIKEIEDWLEEKEEEQELEKEFKKEKEKNENRIKISKIKNKIKYSQSKFSIFKYKVELDKIKKIISNYCKNYFSKCLTENETLECLYKLDQQIFDAVKKIDFKKEKDELLSGKVILINLKRNEWKKISDFAIYATVKMEKLFEDRIMFSIQIKIDPSIEMLDSTYKLKPRILLLQNNNN